MLDKDKSKEELISELVSLRKQLKTSQDLNIQNQERSSSDNNSDEYSNELASLLPESIFEMDISGKITFSNISGLKTFGYTTDDIKKGVFATELFVPEDRERLVQNTKNILNNEDQGPNQYLGLRKDGSTFPVITHTNLIVKDGQPVGFRGIVVDITQLKQAEDIIKKAKFELEAQVKDRTNELEVTNLRLNRILEETVAALSSAVEKRDPYTAGHQHRVALLAASIARHLKLSEDQIKGVYLAALIHDIGKLYVPAEILTKPAKLSDLEFSMMQIHSASGFEILSEIEFPWPIAKIILQHHEKIDGSGYPNGLVKDDILIEARILTVADVIEAIASHRPYRPALGMEAAIEEVNKNKGILYDQTIVDACLEILSDENFSFT